MPNIQSAKKALRQNKSRYLRNTSKKNVIRELVRTYRRFILNQKTEEAQKLLPQIYKKLDKAVKVNFIKKNKANRLKSRLTKKIAKKS